MGSTQSVQWGKNTTSDEIMQDVNLSGKTAIVTGANSGLGLETARVLVSKGCRVVLATRSETKGNDTVKTILESFSQKSKSSTSSTPLISSESNKQPKVNNIKSLLIPLVLDLSSLESVYNFAKNVYNKIDQCQFLINNAGIMALPEYQETTDGFEKQFGVNHVGHQYLTVLLLPLLLKSTPARVICLSSKGHYVAGPKDIKSWLPVYIQEKRGPTKNNYKAYLNYGISKSCNIFLAREINTRYYKQGISAFSVHPGVIQTNLGRNSNICQDLGLICGGCSCCCCCCSDEPSLLSDFKNIPQGAATTLRCVQLTDEEVKQYNGHYFADCQSDQTFGLREDHRPSEQMDKWVSQFYDLTNELIEKKGFKLSVNDDSNNNNDQKEQLSQDEQKEN